jgi:guanylate kinase
VVLAPPSREELARRLVGRGTEDEAAIAARLDVAEVELAAACEFDVVLVNDTVEHAAEELVRLLG